MKLIPVKCPNCQGKIEITPNTKIVTCDYCGYDIQVVGETENMEVTLKDAEQTGYAIGQGMQRAIRASEESDDNNPTKPPKNKEKLLQQLEAVRTHLEMTTDDEALMKKAKERLNKVRNYDIGYLNSCLFVALLIAYFYYSSTKSAIYIIVFLVIVNFAMSKFKKKKINEAETEIAECTAKISKNRMTLPFTFIANEYCTVPTISKIIKILNDGRADGYKEALNLYIQDAKNEESIEWAKKTNMAMYEATTAAQEAAKQAKKARNAADDAKSAANKWF